MKTKRHLSNRRAGFARAKGAPALVTVLALVVAAPPKALAVSSADQVCGPTADPCLVSTPVTIDSGADLDFGKRALEVTSSGKLLLPGGGVATLRAGRFVLQASGSAAVDLRGTVSGIPTGGRLTVLARGSCSGNATLLCVRTSECAAQSAGVCNGAAAGSLLAAAVIGTADQPGAFILYAAGDISVLSPITMDAASSEGDGGEIELHAGGDLSVTAALGAKTGAGAGGAISLFAGGALSVSAPIDLRGGWFDGGDLVADADKDVTISADISAQSTSGGGFGGDVSVTAGGRIDLTGGTNLNRVDISTRGHGFGAGGDGGEQGYLAGGDITVGEFVRLRADGGASDGAGGEILLNSGGDLAIAGDIEVAGLGTKGAGGLLFLLSAGNTEVGLTSELILTGGTDGGGIAELSTEGDLVMAGTLDVSGNAGIAGTALLESQRAATLAAGLVRTGGSTFEVEGQKNIVQIVGCDVEMISPVLVDNLVPTAVNLVVGRDSVAVRAGAQVRATANGRNEIRYRPGTTQPIIQGTVTPAAQVIADASIAPCPICGNGVEEPGETCDDGNVDPGDGCSAQCQNEGCVADTPGYPGIKLCDDGKNCTVDSCDRVNSACIHAVTCVDGVGCTEDSCGPDGECVHTGSNALCEDSNPCTLGLCDLFNDCVQVPAAGPCDDGLSCTVDDACVARRCVGTDTCPAGEFCRPATDQCEVGQATTTTTTPGGVCGDLQRDPGEECDDGDTSWLPGEECRADCTLVDCADPDDSGSRNATDSLFVLRAAVGLLDCGCLCDVDASGGATASDALRVLRSAVGLPDAPLTCNCD